MITTGGKLHIKRYLAGYVPSIARSIAVGIGPAAESLTDEKLQFEVERINVAYTGYDFVNNKLVFKGALPTTFAGTIYEIGLYSTSVNQLAGEYGSKLVTTFDSNTENWINLATSASSAFVTTGQRVGSDRLSHAYAASGTQTDALQEIFLDLSGHSNADKFVFAMHLLSGATTSTRFRFHTDASNYYEFNAGAVSGAGFKVVEMTKGAATVTGTPDWSNITEIRVNSTATSGGALSLEFEAIRIEDVDTINPDYQLVAREVLATPSVSQDGKTQEIEFALDVTV